MYTRLREGVKWLNQKLLKLYKYGWSLRDISDEFGITESEIKAELLRYKSSSRVIGKKLSDDFKMFLMERFNNTNETLSAIAKLFDMSNSTMTKINREFGTAESKKVEENEDDAFKPIDWDSWDTCPTCKGSNVNQLNNTYIEEDIVEDNNIYNSYCLDCHTEWLLHDGIVKQVVWELLESVEALDEN